MSYRTLFFVAALSFGVVTSLLGQTIDFTGTITTVSDASFGESYDTGGTIDTVTQNYNGVVGQTVYWTGSGGFASGNDAGDVVTVEYPGGGALTWGYDGFVPVGSVLVVGSGIDFLAGVNLGVDASASRQIDLGMGAQFVQASESIGPISGAGNLLLQNYSQSAPAAGESNPTLYENGLNISGQVTLNNASLWTNNRYETGISAAGFNVSNGSLESYVTGTPNISLTNDSKWILNSVSTGSHAAGILNGDATSTVNFAELAGGEEVSLSVKSGYFAGTLDSGTTAGVETELVKTGSGYFTLAGNNSGSSGFSGTIDIQQGTLLANGTFSTGTGAITVESGATLGGTGEITPASLTLQSGAKLDLTAYDSAHAPSSQFHKFSILVAYGGRINFNTGAVLGFNLGTSGQSDSLALNASSLFGHPVPSDYVSFNDNAVDFNYPNGAEPGTYTLFTFNTTGAYTGTLQDGADYYFTYNSESVEVTIDSQAVPEPSGSFYLLAGLSLMAFLGRGRRALRRAT